MNKLPVRAVTTAVLILIGLLSRTATSATLTYNYAQHWMFDSNTGLYWQVAQIPTSTFTPAAGEVATDAQLTQLGNDVGVPNFLLTPAPGQPTVFSQDLANLLAFFQSDAPPPVNKPFSFSLATVYSAGPGDGPPPDVFEYHLVSYTPTAIPNPQPLWLFQGLSTVGSYGPNNPCPPNFGVTCPAASEAAYIVSTVQPVPLPGSATSIVLGLTLLGWLAHRARAEERA